MHQEFTEPLTPAPSSESLSVVEESVINLKRWLSDAEKRYRQLTNQTTSKAQFELMCQYGEYLAVQNPSQWRKFYRENVGKKCDYDKLQRLFYRFYKIKTKEQKMANKRKGWYNI